MRTEERSRDCEAEEHEEEEKDDEEEEEMEKVINRTIT